VNTSLWKRSLRRWLPAVGLAAVGGCAWDDLTLVKPPPPPPPPVESFTLRQEGLAPDKEPSAESPQAMLAGGHELFRREEYARAERVFHYLGEHKKTPPTVAQEALFYEAECLRLQGSLPKATDIYIDLNKKFRNNPFRDQANQRMFDIAMDWLEDTWGEMKEYDQVRKGERWMVWPRFVSFEKKKPLLDREGRALQVLDEVRFNDLKGPLDDKALWVAGLVKLYHEDYKEADQFFTQIHERHPDSPFGDKAIQLAIYAKQMSTGGPDYDGRKCAEARKLVDEALRLPKMDEQKKQELIKHLKSITAQQAAKDFETAEFYRRTDHPGAAYFCYEVVIRRYPNSEFARLAEERKRELKPELEKNGGKEPRAVESAPAPQETAPSPRRYQGADPAGPPRGLPQGIDR
jgi:TolA-binding protein